MAHRRMLAPIVSVKHFVQQTNAALTNGTIRNQILAAAVTVGNAHANTFDVTEGSLIKAIHLDFWVLPAGASASTTQFNAILEKVPAGATPATAAQLLNLQAYPNKKNVLHTFQGNMGASVDGQPAVPYMQGWFKIPKGKQRMGLDDNIVLSMAPNGQTCNICGMTVYKEYQ